MGTNAIMTAEKGFLLKLAFALESLHFYKLFRHCERSEAISYSATAARLASQVGRSRRCVSMEARPSLGRKP
jgi:hypothetical protein